MEQALAFLSSLTASVGRRVIIAIAATCCLTTTECWAAERSRLEVRLVIPDPDHAIEPFDWLPAGDENALEDPTLAVGRNVLISGNSLKCVGLADPGYGWPVLTLVFDEAGRRELATATAANLNRRLAFVLDDRILAAPFVEQPLSEAEVQLNVGPGDQAESLFADIRAAMPGVSDCEASRRVASAD